MDAPAPSPSPAKADAFWAFLSFHPNDNEGIGHQWATWLRHAIENYPVPPGLVGTTNERGDVIPERLSPVFLNARSREPESLLPPPVAAALEGSKILLVICSPRAVESDHVAAEIVRFKQLGRSDRVLGAMIAGEPNASRDPAKLGVAECFPEAICHPVGAGGELDRQRLVEPIAADFRLPDGSAGSTSPEKIDRARHELAKLKIVAGILGVPLGTLTKRDEAYQLARARRRGRIVGTVAVALGIFTIAALVTGGVALAKKREAVRARAAAEALIQETVFDLREKLEPISRLDLLSDVSAIASDYFDATPEVTGDDAHRVALLTSAGNAAMAEGDFATARSSLTEALEILQQQAAEDPGNASLVYDVASTQSTLANVASSTWDTDTAIAFYRAAEETLRGTAPPPDEALKFLDAEVYLANSLGNTLSATGDLAGAETAYRAAAEAASRIVEIDPGNGTAHRSAANASASVAGVLRLKGELDEASAILEDVVAQIREAAASAPEASVFQSDLAQVLQMEADIAKTRGANEEAIASYQEAIDIFEALHDGYPDEPGFISQLVFAHDRLADFYRDAGALDLAHPPTEAALDFASSLVGLAPDNPFFQLCLATAENDRALLLLEEGDHAAALELLDKVLVVIERAAIEQPKYLELQVALAALHTYRGEALAATGHVDEARDSLENGIALRESLAATSRANVDWRRNLWTSYQLLGELEAAAGNTPVAFATLHKALGLMAETALTPADEQTKSEIERTLDLLPIF